MSNPISDFYDVIWTFGKGEETIDALYSGELSFDAYAETLYNKRKAFDACVLECYMNMINHNLYDFNEYFSRLENQLIQYKNYDFNIEVKEGTKAYWTLEYHKLRFKTLLDAITNTNKLIHPNESKKTIENLIDKIIGKENEPIDDIPFYRTLYNNEQLEVIYNYLLGKYLHPSTEFEDFVFYMTGRGNDILPNHIRWIKDNVDLAYFIDTFCDCHKKWVIGQAIFMKKRLASAYYQTPRNNPFKGLKDEVDNMRKLGK